MACHETVILAWLPATGLPTQLFWADSPFLSPPCKKQAKSLQCFSHLGLAAFALSRAPLTLHLPLFLSQASLLPHRTDSPALKCLNSSALQQDEESWVGQLCAGLAFLPVQQKSQFHSGSDWLSLGKTRKLSLRFSHVRRFENRSCKSPEGKRFKMSLRPERPSTQTWADGVFHRSGRRLNFGHVWVLRAQGSLTRWQNMWLR